MKDILKYSIWAGICGVLVVPFIVSDGMYFPYIVGKAFTFRVLVEIIFGLWLILILKDSKFRPKFSWVLGVVGVFVFILLIADINAVAPHKAFWSNFERMEGFVTFAHLLLYFVVLGSMLNTEKLWLCFFRISVLASTVLGIHSIDTATETRFFGLLGNYIYISVYFLFTFFFTLMLLYKDVIAVNLTGTNLFKKTLTNALFYLYIFAAALSLFIVYRNSRGVLLGLIVGVFVAALLIALFEVRIKLIRNISIATIIIIISLFVVFMQARKTNFVTSNATLSRFASISWDNISGQSRQLIWPMAIKGFKEKPILGWGQEGFNYVFNKHYDAKMWGQESWFDRAHNAPLDFLVAGGILGFLSYLALFVSALYLLWFRRNNLSVTEIAILTGLLLGYLFQAIFVFDNLVSYVLFFTTLTYVHSRSAFPVLEIPKRQDKKLTSTTKSKGYLSVFVEDEEYQNYILIPTVIALTAISVWWVNVPSVQANKKLISAMVLVDQGQEDQSYKIIKAALSHKSLADSEIREQLLFLTPKVLARSELDEKLKAEFYNLTISELGKQIELVPDDVRYYFMLGSFFNTVGRPEQAMLLLNKAIQLSEKKQQIRFELIRSFLYLGRSTDAMMEAKFIYELNKDFPKAKEVYVDMIKYEISKNPKFKSEGEKILIDLGESS